MPKDQIELILEETKFAVEEIRTYERLLFELVTIFLGLSGTAIGFGISGYGWAWILIQAIVLIFLIATMKIEQDIMMNSVYIVFNENRVNLTMKSEVFMWQKFIGAGDAFDEPKNRFSFYLTPIIIASVFLVLYTISVYKFALQILEGSLQFIVQNNLVLFVVYISMSVLLVSLELIMVFRSRTEAIRRIVRLLQQSRRETYFRD